jgi:hypothetical protein
MPVVGHQLEPVPDPIRFEIVEQVPPLDVLSERSLFRRLTDANNTIEELLAELSIREEPDRILRMLLCGPLGFVDLQRMLQLDTESLQARLGRLQWITDQVALFEGLYWLVPPDTRQARALGVAA